MLPHFQALGKIPDSIKRLAINAKGLAIANLDDFISLQGMSSGPDEEVFPSLFLALITSFS